MTLKSLKIWSMAVRPKTLPAGAAPVILASAMAFGDGVFHAPSALAALLGSLAIQIGTNLANDYFDFKHGVDTDERIGPQRVTQAGLVTPKVMMIAIVLAFLTAAVISVFLILRAGWPIAAIAVLAVLCGIFYTAGPHPLGYLGLGDLLVFLFFGPVAVMGTYYVQSFEMNFGVFMAGVSAGCFSTAILAVNNLRDLETDRASGKKTLAARWGRTFARSEYFCLVVLGALAPVALFGVIDDHRGILWCPLVILFSLPAIHAVFTRTDGTALNKALAYTGILLLLFTGIFALGWIR